MSSRRKHQREHRYAAENLSAYVDDELNPLERDRVDAHLSLCLDCRKELVTLRETAKLLRMTPRMALPRSFVLPASAARSETPPHHGDRRSCAG